MSAATAEECRPGSDKADGANVGQVEEISELCRLDSQALGFADQAALTIEGEEYGRAWLQRRFTGQADPGELAVLMAFLRGEMLAGACRVIEKALGGRHV